MSVNVMIQMEMLTMAVSDTDWHISTQFGNMIGAVQEKSPLPIRTKYELCNFGRTDEWHH